jgi:hypothetical protein
LWRRIGGRLNNNQRSRVKNAWLCDVHKTDVDQHLTSHIFKCSYVRPNLLGSSQYYCRVIDSKYSCYVEIISL